MGEAADDAYDDAALGRDIAERMQAAGCRPCPLDHEGAETCPLCGDAGWLDAAGRPCEA